MVGVLDLGVYFFVDAEKKVDLSWKLSNVGCSWCDALQTCRGRKDHWSDLYRFLRFLVMFFWHYLSSSWRSISLDDSSINWWDYDLSCAGDVQRQTKHMRWWLDVCRRRAEAARLSIMNRKSEWEGDFARRDRTWFLWKACWFCDAIDPSSQVSEWERHLSRGIGRWFLWRRSKAAKVRAWSVKPGRGWLGQEVHMVCFFWEAHSLYEGMKIIMPCSNLPKYMFQSYWPWYHDSRYEAMFIVISLWGTMTFVGERQIELSMKRLPSYIHSVTFLSEKAILLGKTNEVKRHRNQMFANLGISEVARRRMLWVRVFSIKDLSWKKKIVSLQFSFFKKLKTHIFFQFCPTFLFLYGLCMKWL